MQEYLFHTLFAQLQPAAQTPQNDSCSQTAQTPQNVRCGQSVQTPQNDSCGLIVQTPQNGSCGQTVQTPQNVSCGQIYETDINGRTLRLDHAVPCHNCSEHLPYHHNYYYHTNSKDWSEHLPYNHIATTTVVNTDQNTLHTTVPYQ